MKAKELLVEFYDPAQDMIDKARVDDTTRPRLTLEHLHNLRKAKDIENVDRIQHIESLPDMYDQSQGEEGGLF